MTKQEVLDEMTLSTYTGYFKKNVARGGTRIAQESEE